jgi:hypothetical protein
MNITAAGPAQAPILFVAVEMIQNTISATSRSMSTRVYRNDNLSLELNNIKYIFEHLLGTANIYSKQFDLPQPGNFQVFMKEADDLGIAFSDVESLTLYTSVEALRDNFTIINTDSLGVLSTLIDNIRKKGTADFTTFMADCPEKYKHLEACRALHAKKERFL